MNELSNTDLHFVVSRVPRDVIKLIRDNGLFLAGGFVRSVISGEKPSDIDLFGPSKDKLQAIATAFALERQARLHVTDNAFTVLTGNRIPVQFIHRWTYQPGDQGRLSEEFDFTIAQAVLWLEDVKHPVTGDIQKQWKSICSDRYYSDLAAKRLHYTCPAREEDAGGSLLRARKFLSKGYSIQAQSLAKVITRLVIKVDADALANKNEEWIAKILTALLREVDPLLVVDGVDLVDEHEALHAAEQP